MRAQWIYIESRNMKILLVAGFFPPFAPIAATRVNKFAKFFHGRGDDIRVLAAHNTHYPPVMKLEVPEELVHFTPVFEVADMPSNVMGRVKGMFRSGKGEQDQTGPAREAMPKPKNVQPGRLGPCFRRIKNRGRELYTGMVSVPDGRIGWYPHAIREGRRMLADWKPDLIYASAPPHTSLLVASKLSREFNIPWFCEYRDLWVDHPYYDGSWLRHLIERPLERRTLASCSGLVTVTQTWADHLQKIYEKPVAFVMNGFDPDDYEDTARIEPMSSDKLTILYAGGIYPGRRDPSALFEAMEKMGADANDIRVHFYMPDEYIEPVQQMARTHHVEHLVDVGGLVSREDVLKLQQRSDILLLLRWDSPEENGVLAGSFLNISVQVGLCFLSEVQRVKRLML